MCHYACEQHLVKAVDDDLTTQGVSHCSVKKYVSCGDYTNHCDFCEEIAKYTTSQFYPITIT
jgi:hypothetical protein